MYLIPSFVIIPLILIALYLFNKHYEAKQNKFLDELIEPIKKDALFQVPKISQPPHNTYSSNNTQSKPPVTDTTSLTDQKQANLDKVAALKAQLTRIQQAKVRRNQSDHANQVNAHATSQPVQQSAKLNNIRNLKAQLARIQQSKNNVK